MRRSILCHPILSSLVFESFELWQIFLEEMVLGTNKSTNVGLAVDDAVGLIKNPEIKAQLSFLSAFGKRYWTREYDWIRRKDDISKLEGHSCHEVLLNVFCCHSTLSKLSQDWENDPTFSVCKSLVDDLSSVVPDGSKYKSEKDSTKSRITDFFKVYIEGFKGWEGMVRVCECEGMCHSFVVYMVGYGEVIVN